MKKTVGMLLAVCLLLGTMSGCLKIDLPFGEKATVPATTEPVTAADAYLNMAQKYIDQGQYQLAVDVLQEGYEAQSDERIAAKLMEVLALQKEAEKETITPTQQETQASTEATKAPERNMLAEEGIQKRINLFLSNFAEQYFDEYPTSDYELISFARKFSKINNWDLIGYEGYYEVIKKSDVDGILYQYFGRTVTPKGDSAEYPGIGPYDTITYNNGVYAFHAADGGFYGYVSIVKEMTDNGNGTYDVQFDIYSVDFEVYADGNMSRYYAMSADEAAKDSTLSLYKQGWATVKDYDRGNGVESYQLVEYHTYG